MDITIKRFHNCFICENKIEMKFKRDQNLITSADVEKLSVIGSNQIEVYVRCKKCSNINKTVQNI